MRNKELLEKFIQDNFEVKNFDVEWSTEWSVVLKDTNQDKLTLCAFNPEEIWTLINGVKHLKYKLKKCFNTNEEMWVVIND